MVKEEVETTCASAGRGGGEEPKHAQLSRVATPVVVAVEDATVVPEPTAVGPRPLSPPPKGKPSGVMLALIRLAELEAQMEYAYVKHTLLVKRRRELQLQYRVLEGLPVGIEALQEDLKSFGSSDAL
jgi:hypothetical protein